MVVVSFFIPVALQKSISAKVFHFCTHALYKPAAAAALAGFPAFLRIKYAKQGGGLGGFFLIPAHRRQKQGIACSFGILLVFTIFAVWLKACCFLWDGSKKTPAGAGAFFAFVQII